MTGLLVGYAAITAVVAGGVGLLLTMARATTKVAGMAMVVVGLVLAGERLVEVLR